MMVGGYCFSLKGLELHQDQNKNILQAVRRLLSGQLVRWHNAGEFWSRNAFAKKPGVIQVVIGKPIEVEGRSAGEITAEAERWIETTCAAISTQKN